MHKTGKNILAYHFRDNWSTILDLFWSLISEHEMARKMKNTELLIFHLKLVHFIYQQCSNLNPLRGIHT